LFDPNLVFVSQELQTYKPQLKCFQTAFERIREYLRNIDPGVNDLRENQVLFFDDKEANVRAAREAGLHSELFHVYMHPPSYMRELLAKYAIHVGPVDFDDVIAEGEGE
jgi:FMN phosphatase YigB (HAD superfamily)